MATKKDVANWLGCLKNTPNFELVAGKVMERVTHGEGNGLMILQGPPQMANKSFFLNTVKAFQKGVPPNAKEYFPSDLWRLLDEVDSSQYQCVDIKEDCPVVNYQSVYRVPLDIVLPLSLTSVSQKRGLKKGHKIVILCDDLHEFIHHNQESNKTFLKQLGVLLHNLKDITFLGAYTLDYNGKGLEDTTLSNYILLLGYDEMVNDTPPASEIATEEGVIPAITFKIQKTDGQLGTPMWKEVAAENAACPQCSKLMAVVTGGDDLYAFCQNCQQYFVAGEYPPDVPEVPLTQAPCDTTNKPIPASPLAAKLSIDKLAKKYGIKLKGKNRRVT